MTEDELTPAVGWPAYALRKDWNQVKGVVAPWWPENSKEAYASGFVNLDAALRNWVESRAETRAGAAMRFPRFKEKGRAMSCRFTTGAIGLAIDRRHVRLPRLGLVRSHESTRKLARHLEQGSARIRSATVSMRAGQWFVSFSVEVSRADSAPVQPDRVVGVDLGVSSLAVLSDGTVVPNPRHLDAVKRRVRRLQRQAARRRGRNRRTRSEPSNRWLRTQARLARAHARVANARRDALHKLTTGLVDRYGSIVIEDLNVAGMLANRRLARSIADAGWGEFRRQLEYKSERRGTQLHIVDRWYPSSKTCSACGVVKTKLRLSDRTFHCDRCGFSIDRDLNAARNLAALARMSSASCVGTKNSLAGNPRKSLHSRATGTATRRPTSTDKGQRKRSISLAQDGFSS
ncbi:IS200/IS605 family element transposase accessory protein TnpB [Nocardia sp. SYP-A9097]|uniref:IS607 family element RNA-guided endonuclease TnpB n=1 Tax=Nocardia sp. SYP-A9097 TaxID=2663237 RepID=UPI00129BE04F|nr:IS607 family element RNA-guided endonuclease TnpB [Nocardia sp. SYP-A9097]MRH89408.1 IS200/IS605 family element transposase accessory protein TnpB [Nocardia sp. SYP-A9097]